MKKTQYDIYVILQNNFLVKSPNLLARKLTGYDKKTDSLHYGFKPQYQDNRIFRIKREEDRRLFNEVARDSFKFKRIFKK